MLKNGQTYFKNLEIFTLQDFQVYLIIFIDIVKSSLTPFFVVAFSVSLFTKMFMDFKFEKNKN